ncbi:MAG TPA: Ig-like domain-containing protein [Spirochaetota bacterium]
MIKKNVKQYLVIGMVLGSLSFASGCVRGCSSSTNDEKGKSPNVSLSNNNPAPASNDTEKIIRPVVKEISPVAGMMDAVINDPITATFNEPIDEKSITPGAFTLVSENGEKIEGSIQYKNSVMEFKPKKMLDYKTGYKATVRRTIKDPAGHSLEKDVVWKFTTSESVGPKLRIKNGDSIILSDITGYDFYEQKIAEQSEPAAFTLRNEGSSNLVIKSIAFASGDFAQFMLNAPSLPVTIPPKSEVQINVVFKPESAGKKTAVLKIKSNDETIGFFHLLMTGKGI